MKLNSFKFQDGKVFWLPEYPKKPKEPPRHWAATSRWEIYEEKTLPKYEEAVAQSLASAIEIALEDVETIRLIIVKNIYKDGLGQGVKITSMTQPLPGKIYSAECEIEIIDKEEAGEPKFSDGGSYVVKVARLKPNNEEKELEEHEIIADKWNMPRLGGARSILQTTTKEFEGMEGKWTVTQNKFGSCLLEFTHPEKQTRWLRPTGITKAELQSIADQLNKNEIFPAANSHDMKDDDL